MLNGDVLTDIDLTAQIAQHERTGAIGDARARARRRPVAPTASCASTTTARCSEFVEKPSADQIDTNLISAGAYVLERCDARPHPARPQRLDRARGLAAARRRRASTASPPTPTGSTSARPSATCRAPSTSSRATCAPAVARAPGRHATSPSTTAPRSRRPRRAARRRRARRARSPRARTSAAWSCSARASASARAPTVERSVVLNGAEIGAGCRLRDCIVAPGVRIGDAHARSPAARCSARA